MSVYPRLVFLRSREGLKLEQELLGFAETVPSWLADRNDAQTAVADWERLIGDEVKIWDIPGNHFQPFSTDNVSRVPHFL